jgi:hypothetical protein
MKKLAVGSDFHMLSDVAPHKVSDLPLSNFCDGPLRNFSYLPLRNFSNSTKDGNKSANGISKNENEKLWKLESEKL